MNHPPLPQLADHTRAIAKLLDQSAGHDRTRHLNGTCPCLTCRAALLGTASIGYPHGTLGDGTGSRGTDPTSSTERAALDPDPWANIDRDLAQALRNLWHAELTVQTLIDRVNTHAPDDDPRPAGSGPCTIATCDTTIRPDRARQPDDRLKGGLCPACWASWQKHKQRNPTATPLDWKPIRTAALRPKPVMS